MTKVFLSKYQNTLNDDFVTDDAGPRPRSFIAWATLTGTRPGGSGQRKNLCPLPPNSTQNTAATSYLPKTGGFSSICPLFDGYSSYEKKKKGGGGGGPDKLV